MPIINTVECCVNYTRDKSHQALRTEGGRRGAECLVSNRVVRGFAKANSAITRHYSDIAGLSSQGLALKGALEDRVGMLEVSLWVVACECRAEEKALSS